MRSPALALVLVALAACPRAVPKPPPTPTELTREDRLTFAQLEVQRDAAVPALIALADDRTPARRALAMRALGRIGSPAAVAELRRRLVGQEAVLAAAALGIAGATGAIEPADAKVIVAELAGLPATGAGRIAVLEAIGRLGTTVALPPLSRALGADEPGAVVAAAIGLGRLGRGKIALDDTTELALIGLTKHALPAVRYAATYALGRGFVEVTAPPPAATDPVVRALAARVADTEAVIRATAVAGLAARAAVAVSTPTLLDALDDGDWRVAVELIRALGGATGTDATRAAVVPYLARVSQEWTAARLPPSFAHVLLEGLRQLADRAAEPAARAVLVAIARGSADQPPAQRAADRQLASLGHCLSGGAAMPVEVMNAFDAKFGTDILEGFGLSETSPVASFNPRGHKKAGSIGRPIWGIEFRLVDEAGAIVTEPGQPGEICIKGHNVMKGYYRRVEATAEAITDGWFRSGDIGTRDADGYYYIVDRKKDMIIRGGFNVYPREIEEVLYAHPAVAEAAVIGRTQAKAPSSVSRAT